MIICVCNRKKIKMLPLRHQLSSMKSKNGSIKQESEVQRARVCECVRLLSPTYNLG